MIGDSELYLAYLITWDGIWRSEPDINGTGCLPGNIEVKEGRLYRGRFYLSTQKAFNASSEGEVPILKKVPDVVVRMTAGYTDEDTNIDWTGIIPTPTPTPTPNEHWGMEYLIKNPENITGDTSASPGYLGDAYDVWFIAPKDSGLGVGNIDPLHAAVRISKDPRLENTRVQLEGFELSEMLDPADLDWHLVKEWTFASEIGRAHV